MGVIRMSVQPRINRMDKNEKSTQPRIKRMDWMEKDEYPASSLEDGLAHFSQPSLLFFSGRLTEDHEALGRVCVVHF